MILPYFYIAEIINNHVRIYILDILNYGNSDFSVEAQGDNSSFDGAYGDIVSEEDKERRFVQRGLHLILYYQSRNSKQEL